MRAASGGRFIVTIDGPAGAGKSTAARELAKRLGFTFVDTGALYRTVGVAATRAGIANTDGRALSKLLSGIIIEMRPGTDRQLVFLDERDVTEEIRTPEASMAASAVSAVPEVRAGLLDLQRRLALAGEARSVLEGRDTGTVIFPDADMKFYVDASPEVRARRRFDELSAKGAAVDPDKVFAETVERDKNDSTRAIAPLKCPDGAVRIDTSSMTVDEVVAMMETTVREKM
ncbi:MAG: (d)CMP kinase [Deltaproteobacteria bacterium]|nr:(d)CMP kinase [Deltaproteobacteria bacterium]